MIKKFIFFTAVVSLFLLFGCRTEIDSQTDNKQNNKKIVSIISKTQAGKELNLLNFVESTQNVLFKNKNSKNIQDSILEGATIITDSILLVESGENKTYTFPVKRSYFSPVIENLVVRKNNDDSFSGMLMQYYITPDDKDLFISGHDVDIKKNIKIFEIKNLNISSRIVTEAYGCFEITWENGMCSENVHSSGNDAGCQVGGAPNPTVISVVNTCSSGAGGGSNPPIPNYPNPPSTGGNSGYDTLPYDIDTDLMLQLYQNFNRKFKVNDYYPLNSDLKFKLYYLYLGTSNDALLNSFFNYLKTKGVNEENQKFIFWCLDFIRDNPDVVEPEKLIERINALDNLLLQNPDALLDIPCTELQKFQDVAKHQVPPSVKTKLQNIKNQTNFYNNWNVTTIDDAIGTTLNMNLFPVKITSLPEKSAGVKYTPSEFFDFFRKNINLFAEKFTPIVDAYYGINDTALWNSANPLGALIHINIPFDDGTVVCSGVSTNAWMFTTVKAPFSWSYDGIHPVAGNRVFSYNTATDGSITIYTRGVDRISKNVFSNPFIGITSMSNYLIDNVAYHFADQLWEGMQDKLSAYINSHGGNASKVVVVPYRIDYEGIKDVIKGKKPLSTLGCH